MTAFYGARFADAWQGTKAEVVKAAWAEELSDLAPAEWARGVKALRTRAFPPTLPEFVMLCRPKPDYAASYAEAVRLIGRLEGWSDCSVFWAAREIGCHDLRANPYERIAGRWRDALDRAWADREPIPEASPVVAHLAAPAQEPSITLTPEQREAMWQKLRSFGANGGQARPKAGYDVRAEVAAAEAEIAARQAARL